MKAYERFQKLINEHPHIVVTTHIYPDADGIGSQIAICSGLRLLGLDAICVNENPLQGRYAYLDQSNCVIGLEEYKERVEMPDTLLIIVDTNQLERVGKQMHSHFERATVYYIDHHPCRQALWENQCINPQKAATGEIVGELLEFLGVPFDQQIALALYTAILIDTNSFRYPTVTGETHRLIGRLIDTGIRPAIAYNQIYGTKRLAHIQFLGRVLSNASVNSTGSIGWIRITNELLTEYGVEADDTLAMVNHLLILDNIKVAILFLETNNQIKLSLRSDGTIDVGAIAQMIGGGGHNHSAATIMNLSMDDAVKKTLKAVEGFIA